MFLALAELPAVWRAEIAKIEPQIAAAEKSLARAREVAQSPERLSISEDRDLLERVAPSSVNEARRRNAEALRQRMHPNVELPPSDSSDSR